MFSRYFLFFAVVLFSACSGDQYGAYVGNWEKEGVLQVATISEEGDNLIFRENILNENIGFFSGANSEPHVLIKNEGQLLLLGKIALGLSEDKTRLYISGHTYKRIDDARLSEIKQIIDERKAAAEKRAQEIAQKAIIRNENNRLCNELMEEYYSKAKELREAYPSRFNGYKGSFGSLRVLQAEHKKIQKALIDTYKEKQSKIPDCRGSLY